MKCRDKHMILVALLLLLVTLSLTSCSGNTTTTVPSDDNSMTAKLGRPPGRPVAIMAAGGDSHVDLRWTPPEGATSYNLYWSKTGGVTKESNKILNVSMPYAHLELVNGTTYYYRVSALNMNGESPLSDGEVQATPMLPLTKILTKLTDPDAEVGDEFGYSVAIDGNYAIVGAWRSSGVGQNNDPIPGTGAAYIFHRSDAGVWDPAGVKLLAPDARSGDQFGHAVSISGGYAIVSRMNYDDTDAGAVYIFHRTGLNTWDTGTKIEDPLPENGNRFGNHVSISGDYAVVGQDMHQGRVYIYQRTGTNTWGNVTVLTSPAGSLSERFGYAVAISGDYLIVGDFSEDGDETGSMPNEGAAYIFRRTGGNTWDGGMKLKPYDKAAFQSFGNSVAISGDYAAVGAEGSSENTGAVYIFHRVDVNAWDEGPKLIAHDAQTGDNFGKSVAITDKYVLVGAYNEDCGWDENAQEGAAYVYRRIGANSWDGGTKITVPEGDMYDCFGFAVALSGESAIIGALGDDGSTNVAPESGAVYLY